MVDHTQYFLGVLAKRLSVSKIFDATISANPSEISTKQIFSTFYCSGIFIIKLCGNINIK